MTVKKQRPIKLINKCNCKYDEDILIKAMLWFADRPQCSIKYVFISGVYPAVSIHGVKIHVHRLIATYLNKEIITSSIHAHHKDGDKLNALVSNIELVDASKHMSIHNSGKKLSEEHKRKISEANRRRKGIKLKRKYNIPFKDLKRFLKKGKSISFIARKYGCSRMVIQQRIFENKHLLEGVK